MKLTRRAALGLGAGALASAALPRAFSALANEPGETSPASPMSESGAPTRAAAAAAVGDREQDERTAEHLHELILRRAVPLRDAWIEMHVVLALGGEFDRDGKNLLDDLVAETLAVETVDMRQYPYFPLAAERHPFHVLQIMQAVGVPEERAFVAPVGRYTRRELIDGGTALLEPKEIRDELSWVVSVLCNEFPPDRDRFTTARGTEVAVADVVRQHLSEAETAYAGVFEVMEGKKLYQKSAIHSTACNGTHLLYGLIDALRWGYRADGLEAHVEKLVEATLVRARLEPVLIDKSLPGSDPMIRLNADAAKLTFFGHLTEMFGYSHAHHVLELSGGAERAIAEIRAQLAEVTQRITNDYDLDRLSTEVPRAYRLILGDACHAYRGIRFWT